MSIMVVDDNVDAGFDRHLVKPIDLDQLQDALAGAT